MMLEEAIAHYHALLDPDTARATQLQLTDEQKNQLAELQKEVDAELEKVLTDDQKKLLKELRGLAPGGPGGFRPPGDRP
jgi:Spy/CpxP family protein refolding chaperone